MIGRSVGRSRPLRWLAVAVVGALTGVGLQLLAGGSSEAPAPPAEVSSQAPATAPAPAIGADATTPGAPAAGQPLAGAPPTVASPLTSPSAVADPATPPPVASAPAAVAPAPTGLRVRIPALGIDARIVELGFTTAGELDVPRDGESVGWYEISTPPGEIGNSLLGAHFDWDGELAVFAGLSRLAAGDLVMLEDGDQSLTYEVGAVTSVSWDHPVADLLASDGSDSVLTLFTCGGAFDADRSEYEERVIVQATRVDQSSPLAARR